MTVETKQVEIDGHTYAIKQLGALESDAVFIRLVRLLGNGIGGLAKDGLENMFVNAGALITAGANPEDLTFVRDHMIKSVYWLNPQLKNQPRSLEKLYDAHFRGRTIARFQLLGAALKHNYADFLDVTSNPVLYDLRGMALSWFSQATSIGNSGESSQVPTSESANGS